MTPAALLELAIVCGALTCGAGGTVAALRARASARADRLALRLVRERERAFVAAARRLADAARESVAAVREELAREARRVSDRVDVVLVYEERDDGLTCVFADGERVAHYLGSRLAADDRDSLVARALAAGHLATLADLGARALHPADVAAIAVPLARDAGRRSVAVVAARRALGGETAERLATLVDAAAPAYLVALEREHDRRRAEYDALTGLLAPRALRTRLTALVERTRLVGGAGLALLFVDTDRFKDFNDLYGHGAGDALLRELATILRGAARGDDDLVARNGGDEFCLVFTHSDKASAIERAEALRRRIASAAFRAPDGTVPAVAITASIGVAAFPADAASASELLERADAAMYHSKRGGRDAVSYAGVDGVLTRLDAALV